MATNTIFFATNRNIASHEPVRFGSGFAEGRPYYYRVGEVGVTKRGNPWKKPKKAYKTGDPTLYDERPGDTEAGIEEILGSTALFDLMRETMLESPRDVIVHLHGFANSFDSAMERAAQLRDAYLSPPRDPETGELGPRGREPLVFSFAWPSAEKTFGDADPDPDEFRWAYSSDKQNAEVSGPAIGRALVRLLQYLARLREEERCRQRIHVVAHSMGNWALQNAVQSFAKIMEDERVLLPTLFENAFLMASDVDDDVLEDERGLKPLLKLARRVHVYHAENDSALALSNPKIGHRQRLGLFGPRQMNALPDRITAVDCSGVSWTPADGELRHQYYRLAPEVLKDVRAVLADKPPDTMSWRAPGTGPNRWRIRLDSPARKKLGR